MNLNLTTARRSTVAATLLVGGVVLGAFVAGQTGLIRNVFSAKSAAAPGATSAVSSPDRAARAANSRRLSLGKRLGQPVAKKTGDSNSAQTRPAVSSSTFPRPELPLVAIDRSARLTGGDRGFSWQPTVMPLEMADEVPGLNLRVAPAIEFDLPPHGNYGGAAGGTGGRALASASPDQAGSSRATAASSLGGGSAAGSGAGRSLTVPPPVSSGRTPAPAASAPQRSAASGAGASPPTGGSSAVAVTSGSTAGPSATTTVADASASGSAGTASSEPGGSPPSGNPVETPPVTLPSNFVQTQGTTVVDGLLMADTVDILGGKLGGHGTVQTATLTIGAGATLAPGNSPGIFTVGGDVVVKGTVGDWLKSGVLEIEIAGTSNAGPTPQHDVLIVDGNVIFEPGSVLKFILLDPYSPANGDSIEFLTADTITGLDNEGQFAITGLPAGFGYQVYSETENGKTDLYVRFYTVGQGSQHAWQILYDGRVPEPSTTALALLGLTLLAWLRRRQLLAVRRI